MWSSSDRISYAFVERNFNLVKRYWGWEFVWLVYSIASIEISHAHTFWGLCTRLYSKLTAHTLCIYLNRLLGNPDFSQIEALAFPI